MEFPPLLILRTSSATLNMIGLCSVPFPAPPFCPLLLVISAQSGHATPGLRRCIYSSSLSFPMAPPLLPQGHTTTGPPCTWATPLGCHTITTLITVSTATAAKRPTPPSLLTKSTLLYGFAIERPPCNWAMPPCGLPSPLCPPVLPPHLL